MRLREVDSLILSVSRRTDIPAFYSEWFFGRLREGSCLVRNPFNPHQLSRIPMTPEAVECIVFWTKNPGPMLGKLGLLDPIPFYFQFTLTGYGRDIEPGFPHKKECMIPIFRELSSQVGKDRVVWRYDPIFFTDRYTADYHLRAFGQIAEALQGYTRRVVISFLDLYAKVKRNMKAYGGELRTMPDSGAFGPFVSALSEIAAEHGMEICACAEACDLSRFGIKKSGCISRELLERAAGRSVETRKAKGQRGECLCVESTDIGAYHTCPGGCLYCYANDSRRRVEENRKLWDPNSALLCGAVGKNDRIGEKRADRRGIR